MTYQDVIDRYTGNPVVLCGYNTALNTTYEFVGPPHPHTHPRTTSVVYVGATVRRVD